MTTVTVINQTTDNSRQVLVVPQISGVDPATLPAWRTLSIGANGGTMPFPYNGVLKVAAQRTDNSKTGATTITTGNVLRAVTNAGTLQLISGTNDDLALLRPGEAGLVNRTSPAELLNAIWTIDDQPSMTDYGLNLGALSAIAPTGALCFSTTTPATAPTVTRTATGFSTSAMVVRTAWTTIAIPQSASAVAIVWSRSSPAGADTFTIQS